MVKEPSQLAQVLKEEKNALILTGALCDQVELGGKKLLDYAAALAQKLGLPVAATANTMVGLRARQVDSARKMWLAEVLNYLRHPWQDPISPSRPRLLVFMGYSPQVARRLVSAVQDAQTVVLGNHYIPEATFSLPSATPRQWQHNLEALLRALD